MAHHPVSEDRVLELIEEALRKRAAPRLDELSKEDLYDDPFFQGTGLGLSPLDAITRVTQVSDPTTPDTPANPVAIGFFREIGVAWQLIRPVGSNVRGVEVKRATQSNMSDEVSLGEFVGAFFLDDGDSNQGYAANTTRCYQVRAVAQTKDTAYFSAWSSTFSGTTLTGADNATLQTQIDLFAAKVQDRHVYTGALEHNFLSGKHPDTVANTVVRGDLVVGNATPKWARFPVGGANTVLRTTDGVDPSWGSVPAAALPPTLEAAYWGGIM